VGAPDLLAKHVFSEELPSLFGDAVSFHPGFDLGLAELRLDGVLVVPPAFRVSSSLPPPWNRLQPSYIVLEVKMPGDHLDLVALERALLRRQGLRVVLLERTPSVTEPVVLWMVAPHLPAWLSRMHRLTSCGPGCYRLELGVIEVLWIAANELPLHEALLPLLVARSGKKLVELVRWAMVRRPVAWVTRLLQWSSMSSEQVRELEEEMRAYGLKRGETEEERERNRRTAKLVLLMAPDVRDEILLDGKMLGLKEGKKLGLDEGKVTEARKAVERVLRRRGLTVTDEQAARIAACRDLDTLERWHDLAITAANSAEVFG
jgi:hypothetical protein